MDFIKKMFNFINFSAIFTIATIGLRMFGIQINELANRSNTSYIDVYLNSNMPVITIVFLLAGITAIAVNVFSKWNLKMWLKINMCINLLFISVVGVCAFFIFSSVAIKLLIIPLTVIYLVIYMAFRSMVRSGYKIDVVYESVEEHQVAQ